MKDDPARRLLEVEGFEWDGGNAPKIWERHQVSLFEVEQVFFGRPRVAADEAHSGKEERFYALGETDRGRKLFVVFTIRGKKARVISARDMSRRERREYGYGKG
jgi:uncharacterized DUF497 family protein